MLIVTIRTDKPEAELGLYRNDTQIAYESWQAHRKLAETIHTKLAGLLEQAKHDLSDVEGIVVFEGPGSFTGLRIGITVANVLADSLGAPIVAEGGPHWTQTGIAALVRGQNDHIAVPHYGADPHITPPKH